MALVRRTTAAPAAPTSAPADPAALAEALHDPDPERRRAAAVDLHGFAAAVPALLARVAVEDDAAARDAVLTSLAGHDTPAVAEALCAHLGSEDAGLRTAVVETLAAMPCGAVPLLPGLVADPDPDVRILTAMILADLPAPDAELRLVELVSGDTHRNVVGAALAALLPMATAAHAALLRRTRDRFADDPFLRFTIDAALPALAAADEPCAADAAAAAGDAGPAGGSR
ncbi:MAG TPA: HEAT repeat domain-containing protein [Pilimelia sp.]|nr:HEAT repeat domain-containing protein [Pilimelia sp.]